MVSITQTASSQTYILDWGSSFGTWANGQVGGTANAIGGSVINATVSSSIIGTGGNNANYPAVNNNNSDAGALFEVQGSTDNINFRQNLANKTSYQRIIITFSAPVQNVEFGIADIDANGAGPAFTYLDNITVSGTGPTGTVLPTVTRYNAASTIVTVSSNSAYANDGTGAGGVASLTQNSADQDGTAFFHFTGNSITVITIDYGNRNLASVQADPDQQFMAIGNFSFQRSIAPVTTNVTNLVMPNTNPATSLLALAGTDDESVSTYTITSLPAAGAGVLSLCDPSCSVVTLNQVITSAQRDKLSFTPSTTFAGTASFQFIATDNRGRTSNTSTVNIPVEPIPAPIANNIQAPIENNNQGQTPIPTLIGSVTTGSIANYTIQTVPPTTQGVLYYCNSAPVACAGALTAITVATTLTPAQAATLRFDPATTYVGPVTFNYIATSNLGIASNTAIYAITTKNDPPIANNIQTAPYVNTLASTPIPALSGSDPDGTVASYRIAAIPSAASGILYLCNGTCVAVTAGQSLSLTDINNLQFDPTAAYVGNAVFFFNATDNNGQVSPNARYTIPVRGAAAINVRPLSDNMVAPNMPNTNGGTLLPNLTSRDADGTIMSYTIDTIPTAAQGILTYCDNGTEPCTGVVTTVVAGTVLTPARMLTLKFDPAATFVGRASFSYSATDNNTLKSNVANYSIPVTNVAPVANPITTTPMSNTNGQTNIPGLSGHDDGSIAQYVVSTIPAPASGILYYDNGGTYVPVTPSLTLSLTQAATLRFAPAAGFNANATFTYTSIDNNAAVSQPAVYTIPVTNATLPTGVSPIANHKTAAAIPNTNGATALSLPLTATDADGTISSFMITSIPTANQGVLTLCNPSCVAVTAGMVIATTDVTNLRFAPATGFEGNAVFDYNSRDNIGKTSNIATYTIPVTGAPPRSANVTNAALLGTANSTAISSLSGTDPDGTVINYTLTSLPAATSGVLFYCNTGCVPATNGLVIAAADANKLQFDPADGFRGAFSSFNYIATDNSGKTSNTATFTIPLVNSAVLPVTLLEFKGALDNGTTKMSWTTADESNSAYFVVEHSTDGTTFNSIGQVTAAGNSSTIQHYSLVHLNPVTLNYYRLKLVDADGHFKYSQVIIIRINGSKVMAQAFPSPFSNKINVVINANSKQSTRMSLLDMAGREVYQQIVTVDKGTNSLTIQDLDKLGKGIYMLRISNDEITTSLRLLKQ